MYVKIFFLIFSTPPVNVLKEILFNIPRVSFYGFLMAIAKSERINEHIGMDKGYTVTLQLWTALHSETENLCIKIFNSIVITRYIKQARQWFFFLNWMFNMNLLHVFVLKETYCIKLPSASDIKGWQPSFFKNRKLKQVLYSFL